MGNCILTRTPRLKYDLLYQRPNGLPTTNANPETIELAHPYTLYSCLALCGTVYDYATVTWNLFFPELEELVSSDLWKGSTKTKHSGIFSPWVYDGDSVVTRRIIPVDSTHLTIGDSAALVVCVLVVGLR